MSNQSSSISLSQLSPTPGAKRKRWRYGIGPGSGSGKTSGRGGKGQTARSGSSIPAGFEGGQMPLYRRLPKRGFTSRRRVRGENVYSVISLEKVMALGEKEISVEMLRQRGVVSNKPEKVKLLGGVEIERGVIIEVDACSASARAAVEKAGGEVRIRA